MNKYISLNYFKNVFKYENINENAETKIDDKKIEFFILRASSHVDRTIIGAAIEKGLDNNKYFLDDLGNLTIADLELKSNKNELRKLEAFREAVAQLTQFGINTGYDFISGSFSFSMGSISQNENIDYEKSLENLIISIKSMLSNYDWVINYDGGKLEIKRQRRDATLNNPQEYIKGDDRFITQGQVRSYHGGAHKAGNGIKITTDEMDGTITITNTKESGGGDPPDLKPLETKIEKNKENITKNKTSLDNLELQKLNIDNVKKGKNILIIKQGDDLIINNTQDKYSPPADFQKWKEIKLKAKNPNLKTLLDLIDANIESLLTHEFLQDEIKDFIKISALTSLKNIKVNLDDGKYSTLGELWEKQQIGNQYNISTFSSIKSSIAKIVDEAVKKWIPQPKEKNKVKFDFPLWQNTNKIIPAAPFHSFPDLFLNYKNSFISYIVFVINNNALIFKFDNITFSF